MKLLKNYFITEFNLPIVGYFVTAMQIPPSNYLILIMLFNMVIDNVISQLKESNRSF